MAMLVLHASNHTRHFVERTEGSRPVGNGQARAIAGNQGSGNNQYKRGAGGEEGEAMQPAMIRDFDAFQDSPPGDRITGIARNASAKRISLTEDRPNEAEDFFISLVETGSRL